MTIVACADFALIEGGEAHERETTT